MNRATVVRVLCKLVNNRFVWYVAGVCDTLIVTFIVIKFVF